MCIRDRCNQLLESGTIELPVPGAAEKREKIAELVGQAHAAGRGPVVYVGDSATDLLALLAADVGILIGESRSARQVARRFGLRLAPLPRELQGRGDSGADVWEATCWDDIRQCITTPTSGRPPDPARRVGGL